MFAHAAKVSKAKTASQITPAHASKSPQQRAVQPALGSAEQIVALQRAGGNQAVLRLLAKKQRRVSDRDPVAAIPPIVHDVLGSSGEPLDTATRAFMEARFGHDFGHVRVHTDAKAAESARAVHAHAYTVGNNVVFGANKFAPATHHGRELLAHELAHTIQQRAASSEAQAAPLGSALEGSAEQAGRDAANGCAVAGSLGTSGLAVARQVDDDLAWVPEELNANELEDFLRYREYHASFHPNESEMADEQIARLVGYARQRAASRAASRAAAEAAMGQTSGAKPTGEEDEVAPMSMALPEPGAKKQRLGPSPRRSVTTPRSKSASKERFLPGGFTNDEIERVLAESTIELWEAEFAQTRAEGEKARQEDESGDDPFVWGEVPTDFGTSERVRMRRSKLEAALDRAHNRPILAAIENIGSSGAVSTALMFLGGVERALTGGESKEAVPSALALGSVGDAFALGVGAQPLAGTAQDPGRAPGAIVAKASPREPTPSPEPGLASSSTENVPPVTDAPRVEPPKLATPTTESSGPVDVTSGITATEPPKLPASTQASAGPADVTSDITTAQPQPAKSGRPAIKAPARTEPKSGFTSSEIERNRLRVIGGRRRTVGGAPVDPELQTLAEERGTALRRGEKVPGRSEVSPEVKAYLRAKARQRFGKKMQEALADPTKHTPLTLETLQHLSEEQEAYVRLTGEMPDEFEFHHLLTIADYPEFGDLAESGLALPKKVHGQVGHGGDVTRSLEAATYANPEALKQPGFTNDPEAQKRYRIKGADIAVGRANTPEKRGGVDVDIVKERQVKLQQLKKSMQFNQSPDPRDVAKLKQLQDELEVVIKLITESKRRP